MSAPGKSYCIDSTEVTAKQYQELLLGGATVNTPSWCAWNTSYVPKGNWPPTSQTQLHPVSNVDWCDAWAYCAWAGKRLCGKIGGGASSANDQASLTDQWYFACSKGGANSYPYGSSYDGSACNYVDGGKGGPAPVSSFPACVGGVPKLFDMSGNVTEWVDACNGTAGATDTCDDRSGSYLYGAPENLCGATWKDLRSDTYPDVGFRCCFDLP